MTLPASGAISMADLNNEVGSNRNSMDDWILRVLAGRVGSGTPIWFSDFFGKTGKMVGNISTDANTNSNGGIGFKGFMNGVLSEIIRNAATGNCELHFSTSPPIWTGNITVTNNTTGVSTVLGYSNSINWVGGNPANLLRPSANDYFTIIPS